MQAQTIQMNSLLAFATVALLYLAVPSSAQSENGEFLRVCYYTNWSQYRPNAGQYYPENVDPKLCTHLIFAFATMEGNRLEPYEWNDETTDWSVGMYDRFNALKDKNPDMKTLLAVGGWNFGTERMTNMINSQANRTEFITTSIDYLRERDFDGIDLDFEWPGSRGSPPEDKFLFTTLVQEMKRAFVEEARSTGSPRLLLTTAVGAGKGTVDSGYEVAKLGREFDFINIMSYDFFGGWANKTGINAPLYSRPGLSLNDSYKNVEFAVNYWVRLGAPKTKLVVGFTTYGRGFSLRNPQNNGIGAPARSASERAQYTQEMGIAAYYEMCSTILKKPSAIHRWEPNYQCPYVVDGDQWFGYDNKKSLSLKIDWVKKNEYAGIMIWALDMDDFSGKFCNEGPYPLMNWMNSELLGYRPTAPPGYDTTTPAPTTKFPTDDKFCSSRKDGLYPHPEDCTLFYVCSSKITRVLQCSIQAIFDPMTGSCEYPSSVDSNYVCDNCEPKYCELSRQ